MPEKVMLYASVGPQMTHYDVDVENATLTPRNSVSLPANVHYAWPHASREYLYVASSNSASGIGGVVGDKHHVSCIPHRSGDRGLDAAWRADPVADPADPYDERHSVATPAGRF